MKWYKVFCYYKEDGLVWFRIFGYGLHFKNVKKQELIFSERYKLRRYFKIGNIIIKTLKP